MRLRVDSWVICLYLTIQIPMSIEGDKGVKRDKVHEFNFCHELDLHSHFYATLALLENFEIFDIFDHIFTILYDQRNTAKQKTMDCQLILTTCVILVI